MLSSFRLIQKCLAVNLPMKITSVNLRTTQIRRVDNKDKKQLGDVEIVDIDVEKMFDEDYETACFFRMPCEPKQTGLLDMYGNPMVAEQAPEPPVIEEEPKKGAATLPAIEETAPLPIAKGE